ncbi:MAG: hypothetical protein KDA28_05030, partial [Phycisphaerales bacterium]|nr:hypothetical protein [Phycisphaerales bacterium]
MTTGMVAPRLVLTFLLMMGIPVHAESIGVTFELVPDEWRSMFDPGDGVDGPETTGLPDLEAFEHDVATAMAILLERRFPYFEFASGTSRTDLAARLEIRLVRFGVASPAYFEIMLIGGDPDREPEPVYWTFRTEGQCAEATGGPDAFECEIVRTWAIELRDLEDELVEGALQCVPVRREHDAFVMHRGDSSAIVISHAASDFRAAPHTELVADLRGDFQVHHLRSRVTMDASSELA